MLPKPPNPLGREDLGFSYLTILDLTVCIAAKHVRDDTDNTINLELLYRCYLEHVKRGELTVGTKAWPRLAFCMSFDKLRSLELFLPHTGKSSHYLVPSVGEPFKLFRFIPWDSTLEQAIEERIKLKKDVPQELIRWNKRREA